MPLKRRVDPFFTPDGIVTLKSLRWKPHGIFTSFLVPYLASDVLITISPFRLGSSGVLKVRITWRLGVPFLEVTTLSFWFMPDLGTFKNIFKNIIPAINPPICAHQAILEDEPARFKNCNKNHIPRKIYAGISIKNGINKNDVYHPLPSSNETEFWLILRLHFWNI